MNNKIEVFKNEQFGEVRTILEGETLLFCGSDIAKALGYARPGKAIIDHCKGVLKRDTLTRGGMQSLSYIPEGDVYCGFCRGIAEPDIFDPDMIHDPETDPLPHHEFPEIDQRPFSLKKGKDTGR